MTEDKPIYSVAEVSALTGFSVRSVIRMFENEPGTLVFRRKKEGKRRYRNIRIPRAVLQRVMRKITVH